MSKLSKAFMLSVMAGAMLSSLSCDNIYDDPSQAEVATGDGEYRTYAYVDARDYKDIVYLNLAEGTQTTLDYQNTADIPQNWQLAIHRYDCMTNQGKAYETSYTDLRQFVADVENGNFALPAESEFEGDSEGKMTIDMSGMMEGNILYADAMLNKVLGRWLTVDTSSMPPIYTMSNKVYLFKDNDGNYAALLFTGFSNPNDYDTKGYISFDYVYPLAL